MCLDGTLVSTDRIAARAERGHHLWYSGKHHAFGGTVQVLTDPTGFPLWVSRMRPGSTHDLTAATAHTSGKPRSKHRSPLMGTAFVHTVLDDHSRSAYAEIHDDEVAATAIGVLRRAVAWFAAHGVAVERVLSDNGSAYRSRAWRDTCRELGITPKRTRPYRPQTNC